MNQNQLLAGTQVAPEMRDFGNQISDPNIIGHSDKTNQAGNAFVGKPKKSKDNNRVSHDQSSNIKTISVLNHSPIKLSEFPSITYSFITPNNSNSDDSQKKDSSVYVRPKGPYDWQEGKLSVFRQGLRPNSYLQGFPGEDYEGMFEFGESFESWGFQADASTQTRPIGYRELDIMLKPASTSEGADLVKVDVETQVSPEELEKTEATLRGIILHPDNILWPPNGEFTILKAERKIEEFITRCWKLCSKWYMHIQFLHSVEECYRNRYFFEVKFSLPTHENPIPIATASVYFSFEVQIYGGRDEPVKVYYVLEGTRYPHTPGDIAFQQKWISGIICEKMKLIRSVKF